MSLENFYKCGSAGKTQIMRYKNPSLNMSGITCTFQGGLLTARHVVDEQKMGGFNSNTNPTLDIAYKLDPSIDGMPLGWVDTWALDAELITTSVEEPDSIVRLVGRIGISLLPTDLLPFRLRNTDEVIKYVKPGASGSPIVYGDHIIGILVAATKSDFPVGDYHECTAFAVVFNGAHMKSQMDDFGLGLPDMPLLVY